MGAHQSRHVTIHGSVEPGFESVKKLFENNFTRGSEVSAQLCVYVGDRRVVDIWGSVTDPAYSGDTLTTVFSSTKSLTAIALASLHDRGLLSYRDRISQHWPEFGQNGKEEITVADLMRHEAGLAYLATPIKIEDTLRDSIKRNAIGSVIEKEKCHYPETGKREYHSITRGWIANELFRRVDKDGKTIGEYLKENVCGPLGADVFIGVEETRFKDYEPCQEFKLSTLIKESLKTNMFGGAVDIGIVDLYKIMDTFKKLSEGIKPAFAQHKDQDMDKLGPVFNLDIVRKGETSSANGNCSARGLALVAAAMANKGHINGVKIIGHSAWESLHGEPVSAPIFGIFPTNFTQGGVNKFEEEGGAGRDGFYGWFGYGGSVFQWHPELEIGFAYTPTLLHWFDALNGRGRLLQQEVVKCVKNMRN